MSNFLTKQIKKIKRKRKGKKTYATCSLCSHQTRIRHFKAKKNDVKQILYLNKFYLKKFDFNFEDECYRMIYFSKFWVGKKNRSLTITQFSFYFLFPESTHSVDGPNLWLLNLDQDLVNTLRVNFPEWNFGSSTVVTAVTEDLNNNNTSTSTNTILVENQRKTVRRQQHQTHNHPKKASESHSHRKNYSKSTSISSNDRKMAEGKLL